MFDWERLGLSGRERSSAVLKPRRVGQWGGVLGCWNVRVSDRGICFANASDRAVPLAVQRRREESDRMVVRTQFGSNRAKCGRGYIQLLLESGVPAATVKFAQVGSIQADVYAHAPFIFWFRDLKASLECSNNEGSIGNFLAGPIFDYMLDPKTAELRRICYGRPAEPLVAQINLLLRNGCVLVFSRSWIKNPAGDDLQ